MALNPGVTGSLPVDSYVLAPSILLRADEAIERDTHLETRRCNVAVTATIHQFCITWRMLARLAILAPTPSCSRLLLPSP